jgi:hypothetical protein
VTRARRALPVVVLAMALLPAAGAQAAECPPGSPTLVTTVNGKTGGPVYTTRDLFVRVRLTGDAFYTVNSFDVSGMRPMSPPDDGEVIPGEAYGVADSPGTLTVNVTLTNEDASPPCTVSATVPFEVKQATSPIVSRLRRPPPFRGHRGWLWDSRYWFWVKPGPTGSVSPITVEARALRRARVPGASVPAKRIIFPMRVSDGEGPDQEPHGGCSYVALICPRAIRTWPNGAEVDVIAKGTRAGVIGLVKVLVDLPRGVPTLHYTVAKTPIGLDVKVLQDGAAIARLRMAGRCEMRGQFSQCRLKKLSTAL